MKQVIPTALFSARFAELIRLRTRRQPDGLNLPEGGDDAYVLDDCWERAAEVLRRNDPEGKRVREMMAELETK
jgi:hypothetical protein